MSLTGRGTRIDLGGETGSLRRFTLMRKDVEVAVFGWDPVHNTVSKPTCVISSSDIPFGCLNNIGQFNSKSLKIWLADRAIPALRPDVMRRLNNLGITGPTELLSMSLGLSLSDQYWIRPEGLDLSWGQVNHFENDFPSLLGDLLLPHDPDSIPELERAASTSPSLLGRSPDPALNGNLPKAWTIIDGERVLRKSGRPENRFQEPFNEKIATELCSILLDDGDYVPYGLEVAGYLKYFSLCPCMCDEDTEFVPAIQLYRSHKRLNHEGPYDFYARILKEGGIDAAVPLEKMLVIDYILANFDRHWNNFGVLMGSDSREFISCAPVFDTGEALWCDREMDQGFGGYEFASADKIRPFSRDLDGQVTRFCKDLSWFDVSAVSDMGTIIGDTLSSNPLVSGEPGRVERIVEAVSSRMGDICEISRRISPLFSGLDFEPVQDLDTLESDMRIDSQESFIPLREKSVPREDI